MIELNNLTFFYRKQIRPALSDISVNIRPGIWLLAGENGAGKTTMLHIIAGLCHPSSGSVTINDSEPTSDRPEDLGHVFLLEENQIFPGKTIREFAAMHSRFYPRFSMKRFVDNLSQFGLTGDEKLADLSLGYRKKSQLAYVLAMGVDVLLLDEPTNGLDIEGRSTLKRIIASTVEHDQTIILSTHSVEELEHLYDVAIFLSKSRMIYAGTVENVEKRLSFSVTKIPDPAAIYSELQIGRALNISDPSLCEGTSPVDWRLLYSGLHSPKASYLLQLLSSY